MNNLRWLVSPGRGGAGPHRPMLGAMMMLLQGQPAAGLDDDALNLMARSDVERLVGSPRPMNLEMILGHLRRCFLQLCHQPLQPISILLTGNQDGVLRSYDDQIVNAFESHQRLIAGDIAIS